MVMGGLAWVSISRFFLNSLTRVVAPLYSDPIARDTALESTLVNSITTGTNWICGPEKLAPLSALASPRQQIQVATWSKQWAQGQSVIPPNWVSRGPLELRSAAVFEFG